MPTVSVRYIVDDVDAAIEFYCRELGFKEVMHPAPSFAMLVQRRSAAGVERPGRRSRRRAGDAGRHLPEPGGWNRFQLEVDDLDATVARLREHGARFRNEIVAGVGGKQILLEDPAGNPIELFEPTLAEARLS